MEKLRFGIAGCGEIAERFAKALNRSDGAQLIACAARDRARAEAFAETYGAKKAFGDYQSLIEDPKVQAVYIATVHTTHAKVAQACIRAGKAVICEKPFFINGEEAAETIALARQEKVLVMEGFWTRCVPAYLKVKEWIREGRIGAVKLIRAAFCFGLPYNEETKNHRLWNPEVAGGALLDAGVYPYQYVTGIMEGKPDEIKYTVETGPTGVDATTAMILKYNSGTIAECLTSIVGWTDQSAMIGGTDGYIKQYHFLGSRKCELYDGEGHLLDAFEDPVDEGFLHEIEHFVELYRAGQTESPAIPLDGTLDFATVAERILKDSGIVK